MDAWGPSLDLPLTSGTSPSPATAVQAPPPPCATPTPLAQPPSVAAALRGMSTLSLGEDPVYLAALSQAVQTSANTCTSIPVVGLQQAHPPPVTSKSHSAPATTPARATMGPGVPPPPPPPPPVTSKPHSASATTPARATMGPGVPPPPPPPVASNPLSASAKKKGRDKATSVPLVPPPPPPAPPGVVPLKVGSGSGSATSESRSSGIDFTSEGTTTTTTTTSKGTTSKGTTTTSKDTTTTTTTSSSSSMPTTTSSGSNSDGKQPGAASQASKVVAAVGGGPSEAKAKEGEHKGQHKAHQQSSTSQNVQMIPEQLQRAMKTGAVFRGKFRINAKDRREGYVSVDGLSADLLFRGEALHGHAFDGDEVAVQVQAQEYWYTQYSKLPGGKSDAKGRGEGLKGGMPAWQCCSSPDQAKTSINETLKQNPACRATARVVAVLEPGQKRERLVGVLQTGQGMASGEKLLFFLPLDPHIPRCQVAPTSVKGLSEELIAEAASTDVIARTLMSARVSDWPVGSACPIVELRASLGQAGEIESETAAILEMEGVRSDPFTPEVIACLPKNWSIKERDVAERRDFRNTRIFSIDPPTAKDLDDALSIEAIELPNGGGAGFRVGVHIADVASFIPPFSALDYEAGLRATSVYLVQRVVPMLPPLLCEELCSLNPGVERFAFSVVWDLDPSGQIVSQWAGRSVICSCAKLSYPMVQQMIEGTFKSEECSAQVHGDHSWDQIISDSLSLNTIARILRSTRFDNGALRLGNSKLTFGLDKDGNPASIGQYIQKEANHLVEEYMLLANMSVAKLIATAFPELAMLRNHTIPNQRKLEELADISSEHALGIDTSNSATLQATLAALETNSDDRGLIEVVTLLATKPMQLATYFCTGGDQSDPVCWRHYALAVDAYTHFTSPIRRYPDLVVHRLLAAALDMEKSVLTREEAVAKHQLLQSDTCTKVSEHCNDKRLTARNAQTASLTMYLCVLLRKSPAITEAVVIQVGGDKYFSVYLPQYAMELKLFVDDLGVATSSRWDVGSKSLIIEEAGSGGNSSNGSKRGGGKGGGFGGRGGRGGQGRGGNSGGHGGSDSERADRGPTDPQSPSFSYHTWMSELTKEGPLRNEEAVQAVHMPLHVRMFARIPLVLVSPLVPGEVSKVLGKIYFHCEDAAMQPASTPAGQEGGEGEFCIPYDGDNE